jgi:hypothetical protein
LGDLPIQRSMLDGGTIYCGCWLAECRHGPGSHYVKEETIPRAIDRVDASPELSARLDGLDKPAFHSEFLTLSKKNDPIA